MLGYLLMVYLILVVFGLSLGSFVNALVWRLRKNDGRSKQHLSILNGRSMCPNCKHQLTAKDLVPVGSWILLRGKCRYCHKPISAQYPLVELLTAGLFITSYIYWPFIYDRLGVTLFAFWLIFLVAFVALAVYDLKWHLLPDKIVYPMLCLALAQSVILLFLVHTPARQLIGTLISFLIGGGIFYLIFQVSQGRWIGGGDVKLGALLGLVLADGGLMVLTIFLASLLGSLITVPLLMSGKAKKDTRIPFGPFLIAAAIIARLFGTALIQWYHRTLIISS